MFDEIDLITQELCNSQTKLFNQAINEICEKLPILIKHRQYCQINCHQEYISGILRRVEIMFKRKKVASFVEGEIIANNSITLYIDNLKIFYTNEELENFISPSYS